MANLEYGPEFETCKQNLKHIDNGGGEQEIEERPSLVPLRAC